MNISKRHPRFLSLSIRESLAKAMIEGIVVPQGLIAHGRGEAFDYLLGEKTTPAASKATSAAAALLLVADHPVVSVNGNTAALVGKDIIKLASILHAPIEVNLFHRTNQRERIIARYLTRLGAGDVLGTCREAPVAIPGIASPRRQTHPQGIGTADTVLVPLEDGDRAEALERIGKKVIAIDLNPLSRTSRAATISIVDNIVRAIPNMIKAVTGMRRMPQNKLLARIRSFDNHQNLSRSTEEMIQYLRVWARN